jgi:hypothetical protein
VTGVPAPWPLRFGALFAPFHPVGQNPGRCASAPSSPRSTRQNPGRLRYGALFAPFPPVGQNPTLALEYDLDRVVALDRLVGVCMQPDTVTPFFDSSKELSLQFVLGYDAAEFEASLHSIEGEIDVAPLITGEVGLDGVPGAFRDLADPERHCKVFVVP